MASKFIITTVVAIVVVGVSSFFLIQAQPVGVNDTSSNSTTSEATTVNTPMNESKLEPAFVPEGWKSYSNNEWRVAFAYPVNWILKETQNPIRKDKLHNILVAGNDYSFSIIKGAGGLRDASWMNPEYIVDGKSTKTWQTEVDNGYELIIQTENFRFHIYTPDKTKETSDTILSTIKFY